MVTISGILRFVQERRSSNASEKLLAMITTTCTVTRDGAERQNCPWKSWWWAILSTCPWAI